MAELLAGLKMLTRYEVGFDPVRLTALNVPLFPTGTIIQYSDNSDFADAAGTTGPDIFYLNGGDDLFLGYQIADGGKDWIYGGLGADKIYAGNGDAHVYGGPGDDFLQGEGGNDFVYGNDQNDMLGGNGGNDYLSGGPGNDILGVSFTGQFYEVREPYDHWQFRDDGNDTMVGGLGQDTIYGGTGVDHLWGGPDGDLFKFNLGADGVLRGEVDTIHDLEPSYDLTHPELFDRIEIDFSALQAGIGAEFSTELVNAGTGFRYSDPSAGFVYDTRTHDLVYDVGQETVIPLLHLNNEVDHLYVLSLTNTTMTLVSLVPLEM